MAITLHTNKGWVAEDGSFGNGDVIIFDADDLTSKQWDTLSELNDYDKLSYVNAILSGNPLDEWENK
jgi:hypothetical protein